MTARDRLWDVLLLLDTSRLSRDNDMYLPVIFERETEKAGVSIVYKSIPETDPLSQIVLKGVFRTMDAFHSRVSKDKGLMGMRENIAQGFRAGGRAPRGYSLEYIDTDVVRDGQVVKKSRLVPSSDAALVTLFLKQRILGRSRTRICRELGIAWGATSLITTECNALTYAGHTVWGRTNERVGGQYKGGKKYKPREDWVIKENTHKALITNEEAEILLDKLENSNHRQANLGNRRYLFSSLLATLTGKKWYGQRDGRTGGMAYRIKYKNGGNGKQVKSNDLDKVVLSQIFMDMRSTEFVSNLMAQIRCLDDKKTSNSIVIQKINKEIKNLDGRVSQLIDLVIGLDNPRPILDKVNLLQKDIDGKKLK